MAKRIFKYATGDVVPEGAIYLRTITNEKMPFESYQVGGNHDDGYGYRRDDKRYVWHYFLVQVEDRPEPIKPLPPQL